MLLVIVITVVGSRPTHASFQVTFYAEVEVDIVVTHSRWKIKIKSAEKGM